LNYINHFLINNVKFVISLTGSKPGHLL